MPKLLNRFNYRGPAGKRNLDRIIFTYQVILKIAISLVLFGFLAVLILYKFRVQLPSWLVILLMIFFQIIGHFSLNIGLWHTHLNSNQKYRLFTEMSALPRAERIRIQNKYIVLSFVIAALSGTLLVLFVTNNYIATIVNSAYDTSEEFIKYYSGNFFTYHTLHPINGNELVNNFLLVLPAFALYFLYWNAYKTNIVPYRIFVDQWQSSRYFKDRSINKLIQDRETEGIATIKMGIDSINRDDVIMNVDTRQLNTVGFGLIGTGKSASIAEPFILNDLKNMIAYIRNYGRFVEKVKKEIDYKQFISEAEKINELNTKLEEWYTNGLGKNYTNGLYLNEPSGGMIKNIAKYVKRIGLPEEIIWLVNPLDPKTEAINILTGDISQASGLTADLFRNFSDENGGGSSFFLSQEEAHTRNIVTLIKKTALIASAPINNRLKGNPPTLTEFNEVLTSNSFIKARLAILQQMVYREKRIYDDIKTKYEAQYEIEFNKWMSAEVEGYEDFDNEEKQKYIDEIGWRFPSYMPEHLQRMSEAERDAFSEYDILRGTYLYFKNNRDVNEKTGMEYYRFDANIEGLKGVLRRLSSNKQIRRVFFSQAKRDIDIFLKTGGVILVNSAKSELGDSAAKMVAQVAEIVMQSAVFRRSTASLDPFFPIYGDEKNTYLIPGKDQSFLDQNRKFKAPVLHLYQNFEQIENSLGLAGAKAILESYRNAFVFQQASEGAVNLINRRGGSKKVLVETNRRSDDNLLAGNESNQSQISEQIEEQESLTFTDVKNLEQFEFAGVMVINNEVSDVIKVTSKPIFLFEEASSKDYRPLFNISDRQDNYYYNLWQEQIERYYRQKGKNEFLNESDFLPEEWDIIMSVEVPELDEDSQDDDDKTQGKDSRNGSRYSVKSDNERREEMVESQFKRPANALTVDPKTDELVIDNTQNRYSDNRIPEEDKTSILKHLEKEAESEEKAIEGFLKEHQIPREDQLVDIQNVHEDEVDLGF